METFSNISGLFGFFWEAAQKSRIFVVQVGKKGGRPHSAFFSCCMHEELFFQEFESLMSQAFVTTTI